MRSGRSITVAAVTYVFALSLGGWHCSGSDSSDVARELDERLTDAMGFDGGEVVDEPAPEGTEGEVAPQVAALDAPEELGEEESFALDITAAFADPSAIGHMIVRIGRSARHIRVPVEAEGALIRVGGTLAADERLRGREFTVQLALATAGGVTGLYREWLLAVGDGGVTVAQIRSGCDNVFAFCPEGYEFTMNGVTDSAKCQTTTVCVHRYYAEDARCLGLFERGVECLGEITSAGDCSGCEAALLQLRENDCSQPVGCYE